MSDIALSSVPTKRRYLTLLMIFITVVICYVDRANLAVASAHIQAEFGISKSEMGYIFSAFAWTYTLCQIPGGCILDHLGAKTTFFIAIMGWSIGTLFQGFANGLVSLFTLRAVTGMFEAPAFPTNNRIVTSWFPEQERASAVGFYTSGQFVGLAFLTPLLIWLQEKTSWHWVFIVTGAIGILWALIWHFAYQAPRKASSPIRPRLTILLTVVVWLMATLRQEKRDCAFNDGRLEAGVSSQVSGGLYWPVRHCLNAMVFPHVVP